MVVWVTVPSVVNSCHNNILICDRCDLQVASSVAVSACGSYAIVGTVGGCVYKYNLQSGLARGSYPKVQCGLVERGV
jgi:hypothetical protein